MAQPYSIVKHSILSLLYTVIHQNSFSFLLRDPLTSSLLLLPTLTQKKELQHHIKNIQNKFDCKLTHSFTSYDEGNKQQKIFNQQLITPKSQGELKPFLLGQLSLCFIKAPGYKTDYHLVAVTHISSSSTKFAVLFTGKMLSFCTIDLESQSKSSQYCNTINKLKFFPNETLIFPENKAKLADFEFAQALQKNPIIQRKINNFKMPGSQAQNQLIFTSILQEKMINPYLSPQKYSSIFQTKNPVSCFEMLRKTRLQWKNNDVI